MGKINFNNTIPTKTAELNYTKTSLPPPQNNENNIKCRYSETRKNLIKWNFSFQLTAIAILSMNMASFFFVCQSFMSGVKFDLFIKFGIDFCRL